MKNKTRKRRLADVLPVQSHYWMLHDGTKFARFGKTNHVGVLVFADKGKAERFKKDVAYRLPFELKQVTAEQFITEMEREGAVCTVDGLTVSVGTLDWKGSQP